MIKPLGMELGHGQVLKPVTAGRRMISFLVNIYRDFFFFLNLNLILGFVLVKRFHRSIHTHFS